MKRITLLLTLLTLLAAFPLSAQDNTPITPENAADLEFGFALPGSCGDITPDDRLMAVRGHGVYALQSGEQQFPISWGKHKVSPDGRYLAVQNEGLYDVHSGELLFPIAGIDDQFHDDPTFSPDGAYLAITGDALYRIPSGEKILSLPKREREVVEFSADSQLIAITGQGLYRTDTGEQLFPFGGYTLDEENLVFSPDGRYLAVSLEGVFEVATGERLITMSASAQFSPDGSMVAVGLNGVYRLEPFVQIMAMPDYYSLGFDPSSTRVIGVLRNIDSSDQSHVFEIASGRELFTLPGYALPNFIGEGQWSIANQGVYRADDGQVLTPYSILYDGRRPFNPQENLIAGYYGLYDLTSQDFVPVEFYGQQTLSFSPLGTFMVSDIYTLGANRCALYAVKGHQWAKRYGIVYAENSVYLWNAPNDYTYTGGSGYFVVDAYARVYENKWYRVGEETWVPEWVVQPVTLPEDLAELTY